MFSQIVVGSKTKATHLNGTQSPPAADMVVATGQKGRRTGIYTSQRRDSSRSARFKNFHDKMALLSDWIATPPTGKTQLLEVFSFPKSHEAHLKTLLNIQLYADVVNSYFLTLSLDLYPTY